MNETKSQAAIPFWRDIRKLHVMIQVVFVILVAIGGYVLINNMQQSLSAVGKSIDWGFMAEDSRFEMPPESLPFDRTKPYWYAFIVGIINTIKVAFVGIILTTILGTIMGIARLSSNWLISRIALAYVEVIRNIPVLVQLIFWYFAVVIQLPSVKQSIEVFGAYLSQRGVYLPWPYPTETFLTWMLYLAIALILSVIVYVVRKGQLKRADRPGNPGGWAFVAFVLFAMVAWSLNSSAPMQLSFPVLEKFNFVGGLSLTAEFTALLIGLVVYTGAFITEIVRAGIQSVPKGQVEAAKALGLKGSRVLRLVVLPQALRVIVPPLTSQYLNLTKNSSLAAAIGYFDVTRVATTTINQSGHGVEVIAALMLSYLILSLIISFFMNLFNRSIRLVER